MFFSSCYLLRVKQIFLFLVVLLAFGAYFAVGVVIAWAISQGHFIYGGAALALFVLISIGLTDRR